MADEKPKPLWQQHQSDEIMEVVTGLRDGDLRPFATYINSGGLPESPPHTVALPAWVADEIAAMIQGEPWCRFRLLIEGRKRGKRTWSGDLEVEEKRWRVGFYVERRLRDTSPGCYEAVVQEAMDKFCVGRTSVTDALAHVRAYLRRTSERGVTDGWEVLRRRFSTD